MSFEIRRPSDRPENNLPSLGEILARIESQRPVHPSGLFDRGALTPKGVRLRVWELVIGGVITVIVGYFSVTKRMPVGLQSADFLSAVIEALACYGTGFCAWVGYSLSEHREVSEAREKTEPSSWYEKMIFETPVRRANAGLLVVGAVFHVVSLMILWEFVILEVPFWQRAVTVGMGLLMMGHLWRRVRHHLLPQMLSDAY